MNRASHEQKKSIDGVKGLSAALLFPNLDVINSFSTDYMHGIGLGVMKHLIEIWTGKKTIPKPPYPDFMMKKTNHREILNRRILRLKPPQFVRRLPRSLDEVGYFKASELIHQMWFYLRYTLVGLLPTRVIKNFEKLSSATYTLCKENIKLSEVTTACEELKLFADEFECIYGQGAVTMNILLLRHYHEMVLNCGPLWSHSLFAFENNIGVLKKYVCGTTDPLEQICKKYIATRAASEAKHHVQENESACSSEWKMSRKAIVVIVKKHIPVLKKVGLTVEEGDSLEVFHRFEMNREVYKTMKDSESKTCDYFVKMKNNRMGKVVFYIKRPATFPELVIQICELELQNHHWIEIFSTDRLELFSCDEIEMKMMYFEGFQTEYVTCMPNRYGRSFC